MKTSETVVPALERGLELLSILARHSQTGATAVELQRAMQIPTIAIYRSLKALIERKFVFQDPFSGRYYPGNAIAALAYEVRKNSSFVWEVRPVLAEIARSTHQMSEFATGFGKWHLMMFDIWQTERTPTRVLSRPGMHFPINHFTAQGLCYLTFDGDRRLEEYKRIARDKGECAVLQVREAPPESLDDECAAWRRAGFVWERRLSRGKGRILAPVYNSRYKSPRLLGALGIVCDNNELTPHAVHRWSRTVMAQARVLESNIAYAQ